MHDTDTGVAKITGVQQRTICFWQGPSSLGVIIFTRRQKGLASGRTHALDTQCPRFQVGLEKRLCLKLWRVYATILD